MTNGLILQNATTLAILQPYVLEYTLLLTSKKAYNKTQTDQNTLSNEKKKTIEKWSYRKNKKVLVAMKKSKSLH